MVGRSENLKNHEFKKGVSGNPNGRPKGTKNLKTIIENYLETQIEIVNPLKGEKEKKPVKDHIILRLIAQALNGDLRAIKEVIDRTDGETSKPIELTVTDEDKIKLLTDSLLND